MIILTNRVPAEALTKRRVRPRWRTNLSLSTGIGLLVFIGLLGVFAPLVTRHDPLAQDAANPLAGPSAAHWLGTDQLGRDVWARLIYSIRIDIPVGLLAVVAPFVIGVLLGLFAGYFGTLVDTVVMRIAEIVLAFPFMVLVITLVFVLGSGTTSVLVSFTILGWVAYMMIVRGEVLREKHAEYVLAARSLGYSRRRILLRHLLPNVLTQAVVYAMSSVVGTIIAIVGLGFLGLGIAPPTPEWGSMIADGTPFLTSHWIIATAPGIAVIIVGFALSLCGDGLADILRGE
ncbi:ABC transporter permease [Kribbella solani]|uniref:Peptide/nickel transport system permease protein n=1 Tax=Kribbella solani TaxID=236067 RepID=A0A841DTC6_9ACTN|nr:ABC transporter permease [Kribbella solani]MBB5979970.1 peptide/nickel transport system permease protein [Kribbella solani]